MKRKLTLLAAIPMLLMGFSSCSHDDDPIVPADGQEQELRIATRSTSDESVTEDFTDDFTLELWSAIAAYKHETHSMTYTDGTGWNTTKSSILPANAFAYKGNSVTDISYLANWDYTVTLQTDQSNAEKLADADVMIATGSAIAELPLYLNFEHVFAKVTFNATLASEFNAEDNIETFDIKTVDDKTVNAYVDGKTVSAIITSGQYIAENDFLSIKVSGVENSLTVKVPTDGLTFNAGKHYTFDLKVGKDIVTLTPTTTDTDFPGGWNNDSEVDLK